MSDLNIQPANDAEIQFRFEKEFKEGLDPDPAAFLVGDAARRRRLLVELLHSDLELRLRAKQDVNVRQYLTKYPDLANQPGELADLLEAEIQYRRQLGQLLDQQKYQKEYGEILGKRVDQIFSKQMMQVKLTVTAGPHLGKEFVFDKRDSFLIGRSTIAHFQLSDDDPYFSRKHFVIEFNPPRCRLIDMKSLNGIKVNGVPSTLAELKDGDVVQGGTTIFKVTINKPEADNLETITLRPSENDKVTPAADEMPHIPGFQLINELGKGGMGVVYHGIRLQDQRPTALKIIQPAAGANRKSIMQFFREAEILSQLNHHRIVRLLETGEHEGTLYLAMEYVEGQDAHQLVKDEGPQKVSVAVRMICQALSGLIYAHTQGYVHRDIKPSNLLIGNVPGKRELKVADFGLARAFESSQLSGLTLQGEIGGTPAFMPPEQITHYRDVKPAADQYSTAAALYYLLTGEYLFDFPKDLGGKLTMILAEPPVPIQERRAEIPGPLAEVIHKAVMKEPKDRFTDAPSFRAALIPFA